MKIESRVSSICIASLKYILRANYYVLTSFIHHRWFSMLKYLNWNVKNLLLEHFRCKFYINASFTYPYNLLLHFYHYFSIVKMLVSIPNLLCNLSCHSNNMKTGSTIFVELSITIDMLNRQRYFSDESSLIHAQFPSTYIWSSKNILLKYLRSNQCVFATHFTDNRLIRNWIGICLKYT